MEEIQKPTFTTMKEGIPSTGASRIDMPGGTRARGTHDVPSETWFVSSQQVEEVVGEVGGDLVVLATKNEEKGAK